MSFIQSFRLALKSLWNSKVRSLLTMLGIIIGVAAVILIVGLGNGMQVFMKESFASMGTNLIDVYIWNDGTSTRNITIDDMYQIAEDYPEYFAGVSPMVSVNTKVKINGEIPKRTKVMGVGEDYCDMNVLNILYGRTVQYVDILKRNQVCVVGNYIAQTYFHNGAIGQKIKIGGTSFTIVGVLEMKGKNKEGSVDDHIYIPYTNATKINKSANVSQFSFAGKSEENVDAAVALLDEKLYSVLKTRYDYYVQSMTQMLEQFNTIINVLVAVLTSIAAISLVVGGIGIMNIMLVSVSERTREIGIRKALGAKQKHIMRQFVIEAGTTSAIGGMVGILFGYLLSALATTIVKSAFSAAEMSVTPTSSAVFMAFSISVGIGVLFGYLPAKKAAKLNPIDALHYE